MKQLAFIILFILSQNILSQVGIGTTTPDPNTMLDVQGTVKIVDGTEGANKTLVSDANGTASWENINDGVKTTVLRINGTDPTVEVIVWTHPAGIEVRFDPDTETVTVENKTGDSTHYWDIVIEGDARTASGNSGADKYLKNFRVDGESIIFDLGDVDSGWFRVIASDQNNNSDGFILQIVYYSDDLNGMVQYW